MIFRRGSSSSDIVLFLCFVLTRQLIKIIFFSEDRHGHRHSCGSILGLSGRLALICPSGGMWRPLRSISKGMSSSFSHMLDLSSDPFCMELSCSFEELQKSNCLGGEHHLHTFSGGNRIESRTFSNKNLWGILDICGEIGSF